MIYRKDHVPLKTACNRRPSLTMVATTITIHNTGNPSSTAANERSWLTNPSNDRQASFHIVVDSKEAVECIPLTENAWHSGDGSGIKSGNRTSIGIEICESGDYAKALDNAAELVASMLKERGWGIDRLRRHFDWSGKICPRLMYDGGKWTGWTAFKNLVDYKLKLGVAVVNKDVKVTVNVNGKKVADGVLDNGTTYTPARAVAEALGATVVYDAKTKTVDITN
ncbi:MULTISPECIES: N-acetylmuramoyl-L-alanine amidase [Paenibacillus]|uniref:N-acetylmuramoyl-L-alanine amidase n=1 Tax=Paenibacillus odorifer TaxID=189426 RepID=A0AB36J653_9BACL|nr:N-acetylmuramoyl-L-alanine amidase [Paenibacillus odorifer]OMD10009.1 N-acetylmuramoyl-L-alanine amidase [Paenibacillus odorifer]OME07078.1 N-acetylmuramoyl-L-alanine amidase [Paenibacillus odorifer]OME11100.1 N-acetylmuramoyl-L-alanine amidase [Paenibacillus odorifer]